MWAGVRRTFARFPHAKGTKGAKWFQMLERLKANLSFEVCIGLSGRRAIQEDGFGSALTRRFLIGGYGKGKGSVNG